MNDEPLKGLIASVRVQGHNVTAALPAERVGTGLWRVVWSAWDPGSRIHPAARREAMMFVLPAGTMAAGTSHYTNATGGNNATHIARDPGGFVHMVWGDDWNPDGHRGAMYRRARTMPDGTMRFDSDAAPLAPHNGVFTAMPALAAAGDTIHFAWQNEGTLWYRNLTREGAAWRWSDEVDTKIPCPGRDVGPSVAATETAVHVLTPAGVYAWSTDKGRTWSSEPVPFGTIVQVKTQSLSLDSQGRPLAAASVIVATGSTARLSEDRGHGGYWTIRVARRMGPGRWESVPGPVDRRPEWAAPASGEEDVLSDWVRVLEDPKGGMHATWHGTAVTRIYANDHAYYAWRPPGDGWQSPVSLREPDIGRGFSWSYAPGLTLDGDVAMPLVFHAMKTGRVEWGFDAELLAFRDGKSIAPPLTVTKFARDAIATGERGNDLGAWFPGAAPTLYRAPGGRVWADVLTMLEVKSAAAPGLVVYQRLDVTNWLNASTQ